MSRGVLYLIWGDIHPYRQALLRSHLSVKHWHPELEIHTVEMPKSSTVLCKSHMYDLSPFDETLFLDADTTVLGDLSYGFEKARQYGIACCISANPWNRRYFNLANEHGDAVEYSSGVIFFSKLSLSFRSHAETREVFNQWMAMSSLDSRCKYADDNGEREALHNDQALFTRAMQRQVFNPFVLPLNWNLHPKWQKQFFGEVKIWHGFDDIPQSLLKWNEEQRKKDAVIRCTSLP